MIKLTKKQTDMLYKVAERHQDWYAVHYGDDVPAYEVLLELNHRKLSYKINTTMDENDITDLLNKMWKNYDDLINYYNG